MKDTQNVLKLRTHIPGLDHVAEGGIPAGRTTLVSGTTGSSKTVMAAQFLAGGIEQVDESGVFVTFEESPADLRRNMLSLGWDIARWESEGKWAFVDASPDPDARAAVAGGYDLDGLLARIRNSVETVDAKRVSIDSVTAILTQFEDSVTVRHEIFRITTALKRMGMTSIITSERTEEYGPIARYGVEDFVADNVIVLRNALDLDRRRRTLEILKFRGATHAKGEVPFTVIAGEGMVVIRCSRRSSWRVRSPRASPNLLGGTSVTETHISTITDSIILLRYVESFGAVKRGLAVLKMRGSRHDRNIREFTIDGKGMHIGAPFRHMTGLLAGRPEYESVRLAEGSNDPTR